jgi:Cd2+/Zn2+-exporting ATPase
MLPQDKYNELEKIIKEAKIDKETVAFVGDGINDAPVLALSDVGLSMGGVGSSSAVEASDVVIMNDDLSKILVLLRIAQFTDMIIEENLVFALLVKLIVLGFGVLGKAQMWEAVFADVGVTLITIINTMRILSHNFNKRSK